MLGDFKSFLQVERQLSKRTVYSHRMYVSRLIGETGEAGVGPEEIRAFMRGALLAKDGRDSAEGVHSFYSNEEHSR